MKISDASYIQNESVATVTDGEDTKITCLDFYNLALRYVPGQ